MIVGIIIMSQLPITSTNTNLTVSFKRTLAAVRHSGFVLVFKSNYDGRRSSQPPIGYLRGRPKYGKSVGKYHRHCTPRNIDWKRAGYINSETNFRAPSGEPGGWCVSSCLWDNVVIWTVVLYILYIVLWTTSTYNINI